VGGLLADPCSLTFEAFANGTLPSSQGARHTEDMDGEKNSGVLRACSLWASWVGD